MQLFILLPLLRRTPYEWDMGCLLWLCCLNKVIAFLSYYLLYNIIVNLTAVYWEYIDCLKQDFSVSNTLAMEILQSCTEPSIKYSISIWRDIFQYVSFFHAVPVPLILLMNNFFRHRFFKKWWRPLGTYHLIYTSEYQLICIRKVILLFKKKIRICIVIDDSRWQNICSHI